MASETICTIKKLNLSHSTISISITLGNFRGGEEGGGNPRVPSPCNNPCSLLNIFSNSLSGNALYNKNFTTCIVNSLVSPPPFICKARSDKYFQQASGLGVGHSLARFRSFT